MYYFLIFLLEFLIVGGTGQERLLGFVNQLWYTGVRKKAELGEVVQEAKTGGSQVQGLLRL